MGQGIGTSTEKQVRLALSLLERSGYGTRRLEDRHAEVAPVAGFIGGSVERWLHTMSKETIGNVIDRLQGEG